MPRENRASKDEHYLVGYGNVSPDTYALNPEYHPTPSQRNRQVLRLVDDQALLEMSQLAQDFYSLWINLDGPKLHYEYVFHARRDWRFDFIHWQSRTALEVEGGIWLPKHGKKSRHLTGSGYTNDCIKYNTATYLGFHPLRFTSTMIDPRYLEPAIEYTRLVVAHNDNSSDTP